MPVIGVEDVFMPNAFPHRTYVQRADNYEQQLKDALLRRGSVVSLSGPSKSGKTVLVESVIGRAGACMINASLTPNSALFWSEVVRDLGMGESREVEALSEVRRTVAGGGEAGVDLGIAKFGGRASASRTDSAQRVTRSNYSASVSRAVKTLIDRGKTLVIDDFHYLAPDTRRRIARQLKTAAYDGLKVVILSVPHHGEDAVRSVPDMAGRVTEVHLTKWTDDELQSIAGKGYPLLNVRAPPGVVAELATQSIGSPQLMQLLCLETCIHEGIREGRSEAVDLPLDEGRTTQVMARAARSMQFSALFRTLLAGPRLRHPRTVYRLSDGSAGDVYRVVLAALALDPVKTTVPYAELRTRVESVVAVAPKPVGRSIQETVEHISSIAREQGGAGSTQREPAIEWLAESSEVILPDAYFHFYLRWDAFAAQRHGVGGAS